MGFFLSLHLNLSLVKFPKRLRAAPKDFFFSPFFVKIELILADFSFKYPPFLIHSSPESEAAKRRYFR